MSYVTKIIAARKLADQYNIPHHDLSFTEPPLKTVDLKRCVMTAKQAIREMPKLASLDPVRICAPLCAIVSDALMSSGYSHEVTLGNVIKNGKPLLSNVTAESLIEKYRSPELKSPANFYCWLTLADGSILDLALQVKPGNQVDMAKIAESFLYLPPTEEDKRFTFEPLLVGRILLEKLT